MYSMVENWDISSAGWLTSEMPAYDGGNCKEIDSYLLKGVIDVGEAHGTNPRLKMSFSNVYSQSSSGSRSCRPIS